MAQSSSLKHVMRHEYYGGRPLVVDISHDLLYQPHVVRIQVGGRLIQEEYIRLKDQGPCQGHTLCLTAGQRSSPLVGQISQAYLFQGCFDQAS